MKFFVILSLITSLISGIFIRFLGLDSVFGSITYIPIFLIVFIYILKSLKNNEIKLHKEAYPVFNLIYINILILVISCFFVGISSMQIKYIAFYFIIAILVNVLKYEYIPTLNKCILIIGIIFSVELLLKGPFYDLNTIRLHTLMDKQYYNALYNLAIPIVIWNFIYKKNILNFLLIILFVIPAIFIIQIKTLILSIAIGFLIVLFKFNFVNRLIVLLIFLFGSLGVILLFELFPQFVPNQILVVYKYIINDLSNIPVYELRHADTVMVREKTLELMFSIIKDHPIFGIGYGNFIDYSQGIFVESLAGYKIMELPSVTENGVLNFLVEGGLLGFVFHFSFYVIIIIKFLKVKTYDKTSLICFTIVFSNLAANFVQDNLNYIYWFYIALALFILQDNKQPIQKRNDQYENNVC